jgi:DNA-binding MarR family transcriptional regulator
VALNIGRAGRKAARAVGAAHEAAPAERELVQLTLAELSAWNPREFITAFQRWHQGSISLIHLNVLTLLEGSGPLSMGRIADALDISVASATGVIDRMEARGLVKRRRSPEDRRVVLVEPAAGGRKVFGDIDGRRRKGLAMLLARLSDEELNGLLVGHRALRAARLAMPGKEPPTAPPSRAGSLRDRSLRAKAGGARA